MACSSEWTVRSLMSGLIVHSQALQLVNSQSVWRYGLKALGLVCRIRTYPDPLISNAMPSMLREKIINAHFFPAPFPVDRAQQLFSERWKSFLELTNHQYVPFHSFMNRECIFRFSRFLCTQRGMARWRKIKCHNAETFSTSRSEHINFSKHTVGSCNIRCIGYWGVRNLLRPPLTPHSGPLYSLVCLPLPGSGYQDLPQVEMVELEKEPGTIEL